MLVEHRVLWASLPVRAHPQSVPFRSLVVRHAVDEGLQAHKRCRAARGHSVHVVAAHLVRCVHEGAVNVPASAPHACAALRGNIGHAEHVGVGRAGVLPEWPALDLSKPPADLTLPVAGNFALSPEQEQTMLERIVGDCRSKILRDRRVQVDAFHYSSNYRQRRQVVRHCHRQSRSCRRRDRGEAAGCDRGSRPVEQGMSEPYDRLNKSALAGASPLEGSRH
mmetsp:Transcript_33328/g.83958  ORF Transcript_33328/g.83958 Transcript_33328/m.83958 type:complete len:222 (-) Transcript_33328:318-983(-)